MEARYSKGYPEEPWTELIQKHCAALFSYDYLPVYHDHTDLIRAATVDCSLRYLARSDAGGSVPLHASSNLNP